MLEYLTRYPGINLGQPITQIQQSDKRYFLAGRTLYLTIKQGESHHILPFSCPAPVLALDRSANGYLHILTTQGCYYFYGKWHLDHLHVVPFFAPPE